MSEEPIETLIARSSLGQPAVQRLAARSPRSVVHQILRTAGRPVVVQVPHGRDVRAAPALTQATGTVIQADTTARAGVRRGEPASLATPEEGGVAVTQEELRQWTAVGTKGAAEATYARVKQALDGSPLLQERTFETFLQGSYANATNLRGDSDVDVVAMLTGAYVGNTDELTSLQKAAWNAQRSTAPYDQWDFRRDVGTALRDRFGDAVHEKNKCLLVDKSPGFVDADVVPALRYLLYRRFVNPSDYDAVEGIILYPLRGEPIVNFPKEHIRNGREKNQRCGERYKPTVRQVKRLRNRAVSEGRLVDGIAAGYLLECMVYNVLDPYFVTHDADRLIVIVDYLAGVDLTHFMSCDGIHTLFGTDPGQFRADTAKKIALALRATLKG